MNFRELHPRGMKAAGKALACVAGLAAMSQLPRGGVSSAAKPRAADPVGVRRPRH